MKRLLSIFVFLPAILFAQIVTDFEGITFTGEKPPDPVIAVGNNHIVLAVNYKLAIYSKSGNLISEKTFLDFFSSVSPKPTGAILDPKIVYDHYSNRYIFLAIDGSHHSHYLLAASTTDDPTGDWYKYSIGGTSYNLDYPGLGFDENSIVLASQSYSGNFYYSDLTILKKQEIYSNNKQYQKNISDIDNGEKLKPARVIGTNPNEFYLVNTDGPNKIRIWSIADPLGNNPSISIKKTITLGSGYQYPQDAVQKGEDTNIDLSLVSSSISDIVCKDGILYGAYTIKNTSGNGSSIKYFAVDINNNYNLKTNDLIETNDIYYYYPVIHPDAIGNIVLVFNKSSSNDYVGIAYTKCLNNRSTHEPISWLKQGLAGYKLIHSDGRNRWGDYSGIAMDPENNNRIWIYGEWAKTTNQWSTWVGEVKTSENIYFFFTNYYENDNLNLGGSLTVNNSTLNSGDSIVLETGKNYEASTNNERFGNWENTGENYKQNNWNDEKEKLFLTYNFEARHDHLYHYAMFDKLQYAKVAISAENGVQPNEGNISFNDPWYIKSDGTQHHPNNPTDKYWIESNNGYYEPNGKYGAAEKGVFLGQSGPSQQWNPPYYTVKAVSPQTININGTNHTFYFQNWEARPSGSATFQDANLAETPVVFNSAGATVKAVMKGTQLSIYSAAFSNNSQRKVVHTIDGVLHLVYESMGKVWYETSTDNGASWQLANGGKPLSYNTEGKLPAIDYIGNSVEIVWQANDLGDYVLILDKFSGGTRISRDIIDIYNDLPYSYNTNPTVAVDGKGNILVAWQGKTEGIFTERHHKCFIADQYQIPMQILLLPH